MRKLLGLAALLTGLALVPAPVLAQGPMADAPFDAPVGAEIIPVYGKKTPGSPSSEIEMEFMGGQMVLRNITYPTLTPILPVSGKANGAAVIVAPGGGYMFLSMQNEGWRVAQRLAEAGYTAFVLKYRTRPTPASNQEFGAMMAKLFSGGQEADGERPELKYDPAAKDAMAAVSLIKSRAAEWNLDPDRVGMIGFSAGAMTALDATLQGGETGAPDFLGYIYGPMEERSVGADAPPMFAAIAYDDPLFDTARFPLATAWKEAGRPVELHVYGGGGHGFGLGMPGTTSTGMIDQFIAWMAMIGVDKKADDE